MNEPVISSLLTVKVAFPSLIALPQLFVTTHRYFLPLIATIGFVRVNIVVVEFE